MSFTIDSREIMVYRANDGAGFTATTTKPFERELLTRMERRKGRPPRRPPELPALQEQKGDSNNADPAT